MKRLFIRSDYRGLGIGIRLIEAIIDTVKEYGYRWMRLDTVPSMATAQRVYVRVGFYDIEPYVFNPIPGARYMELDLMSVHANG